MKKVCIFILLVMLVVSAFVLLVVDFIQHPYYSGEMEAENPLNMHVEAEFQVHVFALEDEFVAYVLGKSRFFNRYQVVERLQYLPYTAPRTTQEVVMTSIRTAQGRICNFVLER